MFRRTKTLVLVLLLVGCGGGGILVRGTLNHFQVTGADRAAFDLGCPKTQLQAVALAAGQVGITGCGKKAVYVWAEGPDVWVNNTSATAAPTP